MQLLYLIECQTFYKIGVAYDLERRLAELATGNPFELTALAAYGYENAQIVESALHQKFSSRLVRGEWFSLDEEDLQSFHSLCLGLGGTMVPIVPKVEDDALERVEEEMLSEIQTNAPIEHLEIIELIRQDWTDSAIIREIWQISGGDRFYKMKKRVQEIRDQVMGTPEEEEVKEMA